MSGATAAMFGCWAVLLDRRDVGSCGSRPLDGGVAPAGEGVLQCRRMPVDDAAVRAALGILPINRGAVCADGRFDLQRRRGLILVGNYASPRQASATIARTATCTDPPFGAVFQTTPTPSSHTIVAVLRRRLTLRPRAKAAQKIAWLARPYSCSSATRRRRNAWLSITQNSTAR